MAGRPQAMDTPSLKARPSSAASPRSQSATMARGAERAESHSSGDPGERLSVLLDPLPLPVLQARSAHRQDFTPRFTGATLALVAVAAPLPLSTPPHLDP